MEGMNVEEMRRPSMFKASLLEVEKDKDSEEEGSCASSLIDEYEENEDILTGRKKEEE